MKVDWKNVLGAAFFVAALIGSGVARAAETGPMDPRTAMVCSCSRSGFAEPGCSVVKDQVFGTGGVNNANPGHGAGAVMPQNSAQAAEVGAAKKLI